MNAPNSPIIDRRPCLMESFKVQSCDIAEAVNRLPSITALYRDVFAAPPWNEAYRCPACGASFGKDVASDRCSCGSRLEDYYPSEETGKNILMQLERVNARVALVVGSDASDDVHGFAWGWEDTLAPENAENFSMDDSLAARVRELLGWSEDETFFYLSELGLREDARGRGLGKALYQSVLASRAPVSSTKLLMRTTKRSPAFSIATRDRLFPLRTILEFNDALDRVVLASSPS